MNYIQVQLLLAMLAAGTASFAQQSVSAGGKWVRTTGIDKSTGRTTVSFVLWANDVDPDRHPAISITCSGSSKPPDVVYDADIVLGANQLDPMNYWSPAVRAQVKVDDQKIYKAVWDIIPSGKPKKVILDRRTFRNLLTGSNLRVRFKDASDESYLDEYTIGGLNVNELRETCGGKWFGKEASGTAEQMSAQKR